MIIACITSLVVGYAIGLFVAYKINRKTSGDIQASWDDYTDELLVTYNETLVRLIKETQVFIDEHGGLK